MSDPIKGGNPAPKDQRIDGQGNQGQEDSENLSVEVEATPDTVAYKSYKDQVSRTKKYQAHNRSLLDENVQLKEQLAEFASAKEQAAEQELVEQNRWKEIAEQREAQLNQVSTENQQMKSQQLAAKKVRHVVDKLPVKQKFWHLINEDNVKLMPDTGEVDEDSLLKEVERLKHAYPEAIEQNQSARLYNGAAIPNGSGSLTMDDLMKMPASERPKHYSRLHNVADWMIDGKVNR